MNKIDINKCESTVTITNIQQNVSCIVDLVDYELIKNYKWHVKRLKNGFSQGYFQAVINGKYVYLHRLIMDAPKGLVVNHINGNKADNRKENLEVVTNSYNCSVLAYRDLNKNKKMKLPRGIDFYCGKYRLRMTNPISHKGENFGLFDELDVAEDKKKGNFT